MEREEHNKTGKNITRDKDVNKEDNAKKYPRQSGTYSNEHEMEMTDYETHKLIMLSGLSLFL